VRASVFKFAINVKRAILEIVYPFIEHMVEEGFSPDMGFEA
jgi:hypothetical protein